MSRARPTPHSFAPAASKPRTPRLRLARLSAMVGAVMLLLGAACPKAKPDPVPPVPGPSAQPAANTEAGGSEAHVSARAPAFRGSTPDGKAAPGSIALVYTASVQGYVEPCGCTGDPLGGVARLTTIMNEARAVYGDRVVFVDGGDLLFEHLEERGPADLCQDNARIDLLLSTYKKLGLLGTVSGARDGVRGAAFQAEKLGAHGIAQLGPVPTLVKRGGVTMAVLGFAASKKAPLAGAAKTLLAAAQKARKDGADVVVLVAGDTHEHVKAAFAGGTAGLDAIVVGREPGEVPVTPAVLPGGAKLLASGLQAQYLGVAEFATAGRTDAPLSLDDRRGKAERRAKLLDTRIKGLKRKVAAAKDAQRRAFSQSRLDKAEAERAALFDAVDKAPPMAGPHVRARAIKLAREVPAEPAAKATLDAYRDAIPELVSQCEAGITCPEVPKGTATYVGAQACMQCHAAAFKQWQDQAVQVAGKDKDGKPITRLSGHARAWDTLVHDKKTKDRSCVGCHSVGFMQPGGYCKTSEVDFREAVQCESCHGPGSLHIQAGDTSQIQRTVPETTCRSCHQVPHIETSASFNYDERLLKILGPGHGEARAKAIRERLGK